MRSMRLKTLVAGIAMATGLSCSACSGNIGREDTSPSLGGPMDGEDDEIGGVVGDDPVAPAACNGVEVAPAPGVMRRLTNREYTNTVVDLLGVSPASVLAGNLPPDTVHEGFNNNAELQTLTPRHLERYAALATTLATAALAQGKREAFVGCAPSGTGRSACLQSFIKGFGSRAFRRDLLTEEVEGLTTLANIAAADADPYKGAQLVIEAILQSPSFLFRPELGDGSAQPGDTIRLSGPELATRLSYAVLGTTPSPQLLEDAKSGALDSVEGVTAAARSLLDDARAHDTVRDLSAQWFGISELPVAERSPDKFPTWSEDLHKAMYEQTQRFVDDIVWGDEADFRTAFTSKKWPVNGLMGKFYGVQASSDWTAQGFDEAPMRAGLLTQAAVLTVSSYSESAAAILRGQYVREKILCERLPPPPPNVPAIPEPVPGESTRDRLARHREDRVCSSCHALLDPVGHAFDNFDIIGQYRTHDEQGREIDATGSLSGFDRADFDGPIELQAELVKSERFAPCVVAKQYTYLAGHAPQMSETCGIQQVAQAFVESEYNFKEALIAHLSSDLFRTRKIKEAP